MIDYQRKPSGTTFLLEVLLYPLFRPTGSKLSFAILDCRSLIVEFSRHTLSYFSFSTSTLEVEFLIFACRVEAEI